MIRHRTRAIVVASCLCLCLCLCLVGCAGEGLRSAASAASAHPIATVGRSRVSARQAADVQFALGRSLEGAGKSAEAEAAYREALKNDPRRDDARGRLAVVLSGRGAFDEAAPLFAAAAAKAPGDAELACDEGYHHYLRRRWSDAERCYRRAIASDPRHPRAHTNLALVHARRGEADRAVAEFRLAGLDEADARANLGLVLAIDGRLPEARRAYADALSARPDSKAAREGLRVVARAIDGPSRPGTTARAVAAGTPARDAEVRRTSAP